MKLSVYSLLFSVMAIYACKTTKPAELVPQDQTLVDRDFTELDTLDILSDMEPTEPIGDLPYNPSAKRLFDLVHTALDLSFSWEKQHVFGKAQITSKPLFYPQEVLTLDAKGFDIHEVKDLRTNQKLEYSYDGMQLQIKLGRTYTRKDTAKVYIHYTAKPNELPTSGLEAITSDKGLFFINPDGSDASKPKQIWTQGETENNSRWFPTFDKPNERMSQEIRVTVEDKYKTLSNGKLVSSTKNPDGTRTDYWKQDLPHAPYLFMLAIGEFAWVNDQWKGKPLHYLVEPEFESSAKEIFNHTPEMLSFFSERFKYEYPWDKYGQVVVRDFVSGAMENTGAVIFGEFVQKHKRDLIDEDNDMIVAHEMAHHWFGNIVTCESWANLTLNEGFANYSEYLWAEYKYGRDRADHHRQDERDGYLKSAYTQGMHPLIRYYHRDKEEMFDAHSYNKGGLVLHMLRYYVGDDAFFEALSQYLHKNKFSDVEIHELRLAFEDVTGEDLQWFFEQWFLRPGHPDLEIYYHQKPESNQVIVEVIQLQDNLYRLPTKVAAYFADGAMQTYDFDIRRKQDSLVLNFDQMPVYLQFDSRDELLAVANEYNKTEAQYYQQLKRSTLFRDRMMAFQAIESPEYVDSAIAVMIMDPYYLMRNTAVEYISEDIYPIYQAQLVQMATSDPHSYVRRGALEKLSEFGYGELAPLAEKLITSDPAFSVVGAALAQLSNLDPDRGMALAQKLKEEDSESILQSVASVFAVSGTEKELDWFQNKLDRLSIFTLFPMFEQYLAYLVQQDAPTVLKAAGQLGKIGSDMGQNSYKRLMATSSLAVIKYMAIDKMENEETGPAWYLVKTQAENLLEQIKATEKDPNLLERYQNF